MKSKFIEIEVLEELAAADSPTIEGSAWITLQVIEHILNSIFERDNLNNKYTSGLLSDILEKYEELLLNIDSLRPIPNDTVQQIIGYTENVITTLINNPKGKMIKVDAMVPSYKLKQVGNKTMSWIGKQPGRSIKDKLAGKNKVLTQVNEFSYDIKENQVLSMVLKEMKKLINARINIGINSEAYDVSEEDCIRFDQMESYLKLERKYYNSKLAEVMPRVVIQPNNTLISDKYYSKIWRAYQFILSYKKNLEENWYNILERFECCIYLSIISKLSTINSFNLINQVNLLSDEYGKINIKKLINTTFKLQLSTDFIVNKSKGRIDFINKQKGYALVYINNIKYELFRKDLNDIDKYKFDNLERYEKIYFTVNPDNNTKINSIEREENFYFINIKLIDNCIKVNLSRKIYNKNNSSYDSEDKTSLIYEFNIAENSNLVKGRGLSFNVTTYINESLNSNSSFIYYGDLKGIREIREKIINDIILFTGISVSKDIEYGMINDTNEFWILDFVGYNPIIINSHNNIVKLKKKLYSFQVNEEEIKKVYISKKNLYEDSNCEIISMNDLIFSNKMNTVDVISGFDSILNSIKNEIKYNPDKYFVYTVPDSIDEFSQISMKRLFRVNFEKSFPIWRSVAAITSCKDKIKLRDGSRVIVIDCNCETATSVLMEAKYNNKLKDIVFERFAPYDCNDDNNPINMQYFIKKYLEKFIYKYNIVLDECHKDYLIKTGIIEKILLNKEETIQSIFYNDKNEYSNYYKFFYDEYLYNEILNELINNFRIYITSLYNIVGKTNISQIILIGEYFSISEEIRNILNRSFMNSRYYIVKNRDIAFGAIEIQNKLVAGLPTWYEHLPDLSLEVVKNGHYDKIDLIKNKSIENIMGREQIFKVRDILTLEAGKKEFIFPLIKGISGKVNKEFNAIIKDKAFPLKEQMDVKLTIKYIYGNDNSYKLIVEPINKNDNNIGPIIAEWIEESDSKKENSYPTFAPTILSEFDVEALEKCLDKVERLFNNNIENIASYSIVFAKKQIFNAMIKLQKLIYSNNDEAIKIINDIKTRPLITHLGKIIGIIPDKTLIDALEKTDPKETKLLQSTVAEFLCCFGNMMIPSVKKFIISNNESYKASALGKMIFLNGNDIEILNAFESSFKTDSNHIIRSLGKSIWSDKLLIFNLYKNKPELVEQILNCIEYKLKIISRFEDVNSALFKDYCEILLAIIRLREIDGNSVLIAGQARAIRLSKYIKIIDCNISKNGGLVKSFIKFDLTKPESLKNMSDLAYVLNVYLTGEEGANLIQVKDID